MAIRKQLLLPLTVILVCQTTIASGRQSALSREDNKPLLLCDSSGTTTYTPGQPIKLHDYGTSTYGKASTFTATPTANTTTPTNTTTTNTTAPANTTTSTSLTTTVVPTNTTTPASTDPAANKPKKMGLGKFLHVLTNTLLAPDAALGTPGAVPSGTGSNIDTLQLSGGPRPNSELANELRMAQLHEQQGQYYNAAQEWWYSIDLATGGMGYQDRKNFTESGTVAPGLQVKDVYKRALGCHVYMDRNYRTTHNTNGMMPQIYETMGESCFSKDLTCLQQSDPDNASWYYLGGVNWAGSTENTMKYVYAYTELSAGLSCKQGLTPTLRSKIEALREHIRLGAALELADLDRAKYENMIAQVQNIENPTITIYRDSSTGRVVDVHDSSNTLYKFYYPMMKDMIKNDYPSFGGKFARLVAYCQSRPNNAVAIPPFSADDEAAHYIVPQAEARAFGPVEYKTHNFI